MIEWLRLLAENAALRARVASLESELRGAEQVIERLSHGRRDTS